MINHFSDFFFSACFRFDFCQNQIKGSTFSVPHFFIHPSTQPQGSQPDLWDAAAPTANLSEKNHHVILSVLSLQHKHAETPICFVYDMLLIHLPWGQHSWCFVMVSSITLPPVHSKVPTRQNHLKVFYVAFSSFFSRSTLPLLQDE